MTWNASNHTAMFTHHSDAITSAMASQITGVSIVYSVVHQRKHQSFASLAFVRGIHRWPMESPHKGQWRQKRFHLMTSSWSHQPPHFFSRNDHPDTKWTNYQITSLTIHKFNTLEPRQNGRHFGDAIFKFIFPNENIWIPIKNFTEVYSWVSN